MRSILCVFLLVLAGAATQPATTKPTTQITTDAQYIALFNARYHKRDKPTTLAQVASADQYDSMFLGLNLDDALAHLTNDRGEIAWNFSYRMMSLNEMFRVTADPKYLETNLRCIRSVFQGRDDKTFTKTFRDETLPAWSAGKYSPRGRSVFLVHTGMILYPVFDAIALSQTSKDMPAPLRDDLAAFIGQATESLKVHDRQWRDGPGGDEGHYVGLDEEERMDGRPQPANRLSAIGRALLMAHAVTHEPDYLNKAQRIGNYIKHRLSIAEDGAYCWSYRLPDEAVTQRVMRQDIQGEDTSHGSLTMSFPVLLAEQGRVFTKDDAARFGKTVTSGLARLGGGVILGDVCGSLKGNMDNAGAPANWLIVTALAPEVRERIVPFYLNYQKELRPLEMALLLKWGPAN